jgi:uncharacterized protein YecT (DUF1311 family)
VIRIWFLTICLFGFPAFAASFDCRKAASPVETTICATPRLSALDDELAAAYVAARNDDPAVRGEQRQWIAGDRAACGGDAECLEASHLARIAALRLLTPRFARQKAPDHVTGHYAEMTEACFHSEEAEDGSRCEGTVENFIDVRRTGGNTHVMSAELFFYNGHTCTIEDAPAEWVGGELRVAPLEEAGGPACVLLLRFEERKVSVSDPSRRCQSIFCGARGSFDGIVLPKKKQ